MNAEAGIARGFVIAAGWRSSGKTTVSAGLAAAARQRGIRVQCFKKGPDYIDPQWLQGASGRPCYNLDPWLQTGAELQTTYRRHSADADLVLVEGNMGLHDGMSEDGSDSTAGLAIQLGLPVLLVADCRGMHRTVAALLDGLCRFDQRVQFAGVILNRVAGPRHEKKLRAAIESHTSLRVLGALGHSEACEIDERELGLTPAPQQRRAAERQQAMADLLADACDLDAIFGARRRPDRPAAAAPMARAARPVRRKIGIAQDEAFHFYYQDDLDEFRRRGVELVPLSPLRDSLPAGLSGLLIGGGFPERYAQSLSENDSLRRSLRDAVADGLALHAECAGLMYLCRRLHYLGREYPLVGAIAADVRWREKPVGRGYMVLGRGDASFKAHEFHHSQLFNCDSLEFCYRVKRGHGVDGRRDGVVVNNVVASYAHFRHSAATPWIDWFMQRVQRRERDSELHYVQA